MPSKSLPPITTSQFLCTSAPQQLLPNRSFIAFNLTHSSHTPPLQAVCKHHPRNPTSLLPLASCSPSPINPQPSLLATGNPIQSFHFITTAFTSFYFLFAERR